MLSVSTSLLLIAASSGDGRKYCGDAVGVSTVKLSVGIFDGGAGF